MNDEDLLTEIRCRLEPARMTTPLEDIVARGTGVRHQRRRGRALAGTALAAAAAAAVGAIALPAAGGGHTALAAFTVSVKTDGTATVMINDPADLGALQSTLRADGVPVYVRINPAALCDDPSRATEQLAPSLVTVIGGDRTVDGRHVPQMGVRINTAGIPRGDALSLVLDTTEPQPSSSVSFAPGYPSPPPFMNVSWAVQMLTADGHCLPSSQPG